MRHLFLFLLILTGSALRAQELTPAQKAELQEAGQLLKQYQDPVFMGKLLDEQIREAKKNGATPAQIRELEQAKIETINQLKADLAEADRQKNQPASPPEKDEPDPNETMLAAFKKRVSQPDTMPASLIYDEEPGRYSDLPASFRFYTESKLSASEFPAFMLKKFGVTLRETGRYDFGEQQTIRYQQLHEGYVIRLAQFSIVLDKNGHATRANGDLFAIKATAPRLNTETLAAALLPKLRTATKQPSLPFASVSTGTSALPYARPELLVWVLPVPKTTNTDNVALVLTQPFTVVGSGSSKRWYLSASTGAVIATEDLTISCFKLHEGPFPATVQTFHHGKKTVFLAEDVGMGNTRIFRMADSSAVPTVAVIRGMSTPTPDYTKDSTFTDPAPRLRGDWDILYGFRTVAEYFKKMGFNSYDNAGSTVLATPYALENTAWEEGTQRFLYGIRNKKPITTLQVLAHEFTHAVNTYANGLLKTGEPGAINECLADMFSILVEHQTMGGNWLIAEEIIPGGERNMATPSAMGDAETYNEPPWAATGNTDPDQGGIHTNSGVGNRWFYLLVKGGKGKNAHKQEYDVKTPIGYDRVARLLLQTLPRLTPAATYEDFSRETIATAEQLFGECTDYTQSVRQAWYAVGVLDDPPVSCKPVWIMEMVMKAGSEKSRSMLYIKGDSIVWVYKDPDSIMKIFTRRSSAYMTSVVQDADGLHTASLPKDYMNNYYQKAEELIPVQEAMMAEQLRQVRATINNPAANAEDRAQAREAEALLVNGQREITKARAELKADQAELAQPVKAVSEAAFWRNQGGKRKFDKAYIKATTRYEGKYLTRKYVLSEAMSWWSTLDIPLRLSDICQIIPLGPALAMRSSPIDYMMRGFPVRYMDMMQMQNIREAVPINFDALFSEAAVFN